MNRQKNLQTNKRSKPRTRSNYCMETDAGQGSDRLACPSRATFEIYNADFCSVLERVGLFTCIITDPPYPDYHVELYGYEDISFLQDYDCRQLVFWSAKVDFPIDYSAIHIWDKKTGAGSEYERIFEINGQANYKVFRHYLINSTVAASYTRDIFTGHPSQKPILLMREMVQKFTSPGDTVIDMFMGSGSTGVACLELGRSFIGIEKQTKWFNIAKRRLESAQPALFTTEGGATQLELGTSESMVPSND